MNEPTNQATPDGAVALAEHWLASLFAPWVQALGLKVESIEPGVASVRLPFDPSLCRSGGTICGQALMSAADTAMVFAIGSLFGEFRPTTTVSLNTSFLRPVAEGDVMIVARVIKPGRTLMFGEIAMTGADGKLAAQASTTYAML
ncbi:MAG: PaaI family thioesterase [Burkholderiaceae bacterium]